MSETDHDPHCDGLPSHSPEELRARKLVALDVGDIFGAAPVDGKTLVPFLVVYADDDVLRVRAMTSQFPLTFDRKSGEAIGPGDAGQRIWRIVSMQPLPLEYHHLMLSLDRRMRLGSNGSTNPVDDGDIRAVLYLEEHWSRYPI